MTNDLYEEVDQRFYMTREESYLTPYKGTKVTALTATYPYLIPVPLIEGGCDIDIPKIIKQKIYGIGGGKHPTTIANTKQEPVTFTLETKFQTALFMSYAIASMSSSVTATGLQAEAGTITCVADVSDSLDGTYFLIESIDGSGDNQTYCIWIDTDDSGTAYPGPAEIDVGNRIEVTGIATNDTAATVAGFIEAAIEALDIVSSAADAVITYACDNNGSVMHARDGSAPTGFTFAITTNGASTHTISEGIGREQPSFTLHVEQNQDEDGDDIRFDLFGCVVSNYKIKVDYEDALVTETIEITCPHYAVGNNNLNLPPQFDTDHSPATWVDMKEAATKYLLMEGTTDTTPAIVKTLELSINNNVSAQPEIGYRYANYMISSKREVQLTMSGYADNKDRIEDLLDTWSVINNYLTNRSGRINSLFKLQREATYDYFELAIYNWIVEEHSFKIFSIEDGVLGFDLTLSDATPDANKRIFNSFIVKDYLQDYQYE